MFEQFFGFTDKPFDKGITVKNMFYSDSLKELQKRFDYMKTYRGIMVLTGDSGAGKTTALRQLISTCSSNYFCIYLPLSTIGVSDFYRYLNNSLNGDRAYFKSDVFRSIQSRIIDLTVNKNQVPVIIFDEAHLLRTCNIQELQIISNVKCDSFDPAIFILTGQNILLDRLSKTILNSFYQRISMRYHLPCLSREETESYIIHQFKVCNCNDKILNDGAFDSVFKYSAGSIRIIGSIVTKALINSFIRKKRTIDGDDIASIIQEVF